MLLRSVCVWLLSFRFFLFFYYVKKLSKLGSYCKFTYQTKILSQCGFDVDVFYWTNLSQIITAVIQPCEAPVKLHVIVTANILRFSFPSKPVLIRFLLQSYSYV